MSKSIEELLSTVQIGKQTILDVIEEVSGDGGTKRTIAFGERELNREPPDTPIRKESDARAHEFHTVDALLEYLSKFGGQNVVALGDVEKQLVSITLDERDDDGREIVFLKPTLDPRVRPWVELLGKSLSVLAFAQFVLEHRRQVVSPSPAEVVLIFSQLTAENKFTLHRGQGKHALNGLLVETKIGGGKTQSEAVDIPDVLVIQAPIFVGSSPVSIDLDLLVTSPSPESIVVKVSSSDFETQRIDAFDSILEAIEVADGVVSGRGKVAYRDWKYLTRE